MAINSTFDITINYSGNSAYQSLFDNAAARWEQIITADIPDVTGGAYGFVDDLLIDASVITIDGSGGILGQAGWDARRNSSAGGLPYHGEMEFDSADVAGMFSNGTLYDVILHEMGHVLGIGTLWQTFGLISTSLHRYFGTNAVAEYRVLIGDPSASYVPIEDSGGSGTVNSHWDEQLFDAELMTGFIEASTIDMPVSRMTIASLADLGYVVNLAVADAYAIPGFTPAPTAPVSLVGDSADNTLTGGAGNDTLRGMAGNDRLWGYDGNDLLIGDAGADVLTGGGGIDEAAYHTSSAAVSIDLSAGFSNGGDANGDLFGSIENIIGTPFSDYLGGDNADNTLYGLEGDDMLRGESGNDILVGGPGADSFSGGAGTDTVSYHSATDSIRVVLFQNIGRYHEAEGDTFGSIENVIGSPFADELFGDNAANSLFGQAGNDTLEGDAGNDTLEGGDGLDKLYGQDGDDILYGGSGQDRLFGGAGADTFLFKSITDSTLSEPDEIVEFTSAHGDKIDLTMIDANTAAGGDQAFTYIGGGAFTGTAGQLHYVGVFLEGDVDGNGTADFRIQLNVSSLAASDFVL